MNLNYLSEAFQDGLHIEHPTFGTITFRLHMLGELVLPSGKVVACDPLVFPETTPFALQVPPGRYPVMLNVAILPEERHYRAAYAILKLSEQTPIRWEMATAEAQDANILEEDEIFCYPVDAGTGCFMDAEVGQRLQQRSDGDRDFGDDLLDALDHSSGPYVDAANLCLDEAGANIIAFSSGWGDGCYASYWGYNAENKLACLVTDFSLFEHPIFFQDDEDDEDD